jgi:hypothetical protein
MKTDGVDRRIVVAGLATIATTAQAAEARAAPDSTPPPTYFVLFHTPGPARRAGFDFRHQPGVMGHVRYVSQFEANGLLAMGGPFLDDSGGMMVTRTTSI